MHANTPPPPYWAVIFTSLRSDDRGGYDEMSARMVELAQRQPGFLGVESARGADGVGITVSYWKDLQSIRAWKAHAEHRVAQSTGRERWYSSYKTRVCKVDYDYDFTSMATRPRT